MKPDQLKPKLLGFKSNDPDHTKTEISPLSGHILDKDEAQRPMRRSIRVSEVPRVSQSINLEKIEPPCIRIDTRKISHHFHIVGKILLKALYYPQITSLLNVLILVLSAQYIVVFAIVFGANIQSRRIKIYSFSLLLFVLSVILCFIIKILSTKFIFRKRKEGSKKKPRSNQLSFCLKRIILYAIGQTIVVYTIFKIFFIFITEERYLTEKLQSFFGLLTFFVVLYIISRNPESVSWKIIFISAICSTFIADRLLTNKVLSYILTEVFGQIRKVYSIESYLATYLLNFSILNSFIANIVSKISLSIVFSLLVMLFNVVNSLESVICKLFYTKHFTPIEIICVIFNMLGQPLTSLFILRLIYNHLTASELHTILTSTFCSSYLFGDVFYETVLTDHAVVCKLMMSPLVLAITKLIYPSPKEGNRFPTKLYGHRMSFTSREMASKLSVFIGKMISYLIGTLFACAIFCELISVGLVIISDILLIPQNLMTLPKLVAILYYPFFAFLMGFSTEDRQAASLLTAHRTTFFVKKPYKQLSQLIVNRWLYSCAKSVNTSLYEQGDLNAIIPDYYERESLKPVVFNKFLDTRSEILLLYSLGTNASFVFACSIFAVHIASHPNRRHIVPLLLLRSLVTSILVVFAATAIVGILYQPTMGINCKLTLTSKEDSCKKFIEFYSKSGISNPLSLCSLAGGEISSYGDYR